MQKNYKLKTELLILAFRLLIILISLIGILAPTQNTFWGQFWFFTLQTNMLVIIVTMLLAISQICNLCKIKNHIFSKPWLKILHIASTFYITITGVIYCFVLVPVAIMTNSPIAASLSYRDIFLHIFVPVLSIVDYFSLDAKIYLSKSSALLFLVYPFFYVLIIFSRAALGGNAFPGGSYYPYFFIDPTFNNQGWLAVIFYSALCLILFYLLALLYIFINNKLIEINYSSNKKSDSN